VILDGGNYTVSGYVKNETGSSFYTLDIENESYTISNQTSVPSDSEWHYIEYKFGVTTNNKDINIVLKNSHNGDIYFDNLQIVEGFSDTRINLIDNPSYEQNSDNWNGYYASRTYDNDETQDLKDSILGDYYYSITGTPKYERYLYTTLDSSEFSDDSNYVLGNWVKGDVAPNKKSDNTHYERSYGVEVEMYTSSTLIDTLFFEYNSDLEDWQYVVNSFYVPTGIDSIKIKAIFQGVGTVYLDGFQLYQESYGSSAEYDDYGNISKSYSPTSDGATTYTIISGTKFLYDTVTTPEGLEYSYGYNTDYRIDETFKDSSTTSTIEYDSITGKVSKVIIGNSTANYENLTSYDSTGMYMDSSEDEYGELFSYLVDYDTGLLSSFTDPKGEVTSFEYSKEGRLYKKTTDTYDNEYTYEDDLLISIEINGFTYDIDYDDLDRIETIYVNKGTVNEVTLIDNEYLNETHNSVVYETSHLEQKTYSNGNQVKLTYDDNDRVYQVSFRSSTSSSFTLRFQYEYNHMGQLSILSDFHNSIEYYYSYDIGGRVKNITDNSGNKISYSYDNAGNVSKVDTLIDGDSHSIEYTFDLNNGKYDKTETTTFTKDYTFESNNLERLESITITSGTSTINDISIGFDNSSVVNGNSSTRILTYYQDFKGDSSDNVQETIEYDELGYITYIEYNATDKTFAYDSFGQLIREDNDYSYYTYIYEYDSNGNRTRKNIYTYTTVATENLPTAVDYEIYTYQSTGWKDILTSVKYYDNSTLDYTDTYNYDTDLNITGVSTTDASKENVTYGFEGRSLTSVSSTNHTYTYKYNQSGIRTSKTIDGVTTTYYLQGGLVIYEETGTDSLYYNYDIDGTLISMVYNSDEYFYVYNVLGDVIHLLDDEGNIAATYEYDPYGRILNFSSLTTIGQVNPYRYKSYRYDTETNLYYLMSRYYNPETGRFINADGLLQASDTVLGHNMFTYTENNPVMNTDPTGYCSFADGFDAMTEGHDISCGGILRFAQRGNGASQEMIETWFSIKTAASLVGSYDPSMSMEYLLMEYGSYAFEAGSIIVGDIGYVVATGGKGVASSLGKVVGLFGDTLAFLGALMYYQTQTTNSDVYIIAAILEAILQYGVSIVMEQISTAIAASATAFAPVIKMIMAPAFAILGEMIEDAGRDYLKEFGGD
jgi:RHS repeat-associated protein